MSDLISRQDAIDVLYDWERKYDWDTHCRENYDDPYIISPTSVIEQLPPAEPEKRTNKRTNKRTETHECDLISRQAAIDTAVEAADEWDGGYSRSREEIITMKLRMLPSAEPEIIRCKDCRYSIDEYGDGECYCKRPSRELVWIGKRWDFFCAAAKLKMEVEHD